MEETHFWNPMSVEDAGQLDIHHRLTGTKIRTIFRTNGDAE